MRLTQPIRADAAWNSGSFGPRESFRLPDGRWTLPFHYGLDTAAPEGTPIYAAMSGEVTVAGWDHSGYGGGNQVAITSGKYTWWALHMRDPARVYVGQKVKAGELIGYVGTTGASTGPHLHEELHVNGVPVDPAKFYKAEKQAPKAKEKPVALTKAEKNQLKHIHDQTAEIHAFRRPVTRDGKQIAMRQDLADTGTLVRRILAAVTRPVYRWIGGERVEVSQIQDQADTNSLARETLVQTEILRAQMNALCRTAGLDNDALRDEGFAAGMERLKGLLGARAGDAPNDSKPE